MKVIPQSEASDVDLMADSDNDDGAIEVIDELERGRYPNQPMFF